MNHQNGFLWMNRFTSAFRDINPGTNGQGIAFAPDGNLYGIGQVPGENTKLYLIDSLTGACGLEGDTGGMHNVRGLEFIPNLLTPVPTFILLLLD
jgi:hypothetical protein